MRADSPDSATSEPAMNAPSATEYPKASAASAAAKQMPMLVTSVMSALSARVTTRTSRGTMSAPTPISTTRKVASRTLVPRRTPAVIPPPAATAVSIATSRIAIRSSTTRMPNTMSRTRPVTFNSANAFATIVVLEMATIAPVNTLSMGVQPSA